MTGSGTGFILFLLTVLFSSCSPNNEDLKLFQEYLRFNTAHPEPDLEPVLRWIEKKGKSLSLDFRRLDVSNGGNGTIPVAWLTWAGSNPNLSSILLYNHMDVVGADLNTWTVDPFGGKLVDGKIYGRGTQDMKSIAVQHLLAVRNLKSRGYTPVRTIHLGFFPDEETAENGIQSFLLTPEFKRLNIGFALDEGVPNENPNLADIYYAQRITLWIKFIVTGRSGHGSLLLSDTAGEKLRKVIDTVMDLREREKWRFTKTEGLLLGSVTSINLNMLEGGIQPNVIPPALSVTFDIRLTPQWSLREFQAFLNETCRFAGEGVRYETLFSVPWETGYSSTDVTQSSWWWSSVRKAFISMNITVAPRVFPAGTDGRHLRQVGVPVLGFSPIFKTPNLLHAPDEYLSTEDFFRGIGIYETIIESLASAASDNFQFLTESPPVPTAASPMIPAPVTAKPPKKNSGNRQTLSLLISSFLFYQVLFTGFQF